MVIGWALRIIMQFQIKNLQKSINDIMRQIGYKPAYFQKKGEVSIVRQISGNAYPRFHLYLKNSGADFIFNLHYLLSIWILFVFAFK